MAEKERKVVQAPKVDDDLLRKHLPMEAYEALMKERIEHQKLQQDYFISRDFAEKLQGEIDALKKQLSAHTDMDKKVAEVQARADEIRKLLKENEEEEDRMATEREAIQEEQRRLDIHRAQIETQVWKESAQFCKDVALGLVRNTEYKRKVFETKPTEVEQWIPEQTSPYNSTGRNVPAHTEKKLVPVPTVTEETRTKE